MGPVRTLILGARRSDAELIAAECSRSGIDIQWNWVDNEPDYCRFLAETADVVLCDGDLPWLNVKRALQLLHESGADVPFVVVAKTPDVADAVDAIRHGAADYLPLDRLPARLNAVVTETARRKQERVQHQQSIARQQSAAAVFQNVVEYSLVGIQILQDGKYAFANRRVAALFGYTQDELLALDSWTEVVAPCDREMVLDQVRRRISGETPYAQYIFRGMRKDRTTVDVEIRSDRTELNGRPAVIGTLIDVTERQRADVVLRESEERFRSAFERTDVAMVLTDLEHRFVRANSAFARLFGYSDDEILKLSLSDITHPDHLADSYEYRKPLLAGERDYFQMEKRYLRKDGQLLWGLTNVSLLRGPDGHPHSYVGQVQDITERKQAMQALRAAELKFRTLVELSIVGFYILQGDRLTYVNPRLCEITGYSPEEMTSRPLLDLIAEEDRPIVAENIRQRIEGKIQSLRYSLRMKHREGRIVHVEVHGTITEQDGKPAIIGVLMDMTEQRRAEEERNRFFGLSQDMFCIAAYDGKLKRLNPAWEKTLGWPLEVLLGNSFLTIVHPDDQELSRRHWYDLISTGRTSSSIEIRCRCQDGSYKWVLWRAVPDPLQQLVYATATDLTEAKRLEEQLRQSQKMDAVGRLAGGVAHDFNNLLTIINGYSEIIADDLPPGTRMRQSVEEIMNAGERAANLTRQLLTFSRQQVLMPVTLNLNDRFRDMENMLGRLIGEDVELRFVEDRQIWPIRADAGQIEQVVMNLVVNARDAMPRGGKLTIESSNVELDDTYVAMHRDAQPGQFVMLAVSDTGCGIDKPTRSRIFEPFFTTKGDRGTGLGLSTVYGIVRQSGGHIEVYSEIGIGTSFKVYFPRDHSGESMTSSSPEPRALPGGDETILLVEDEDAVRGLARLVLEKRGYHVIEARDGADALRLSEEAPSTIHLMVTDVVMPQMSGRILAERLQTLRPEMSVLYMSGYTDDTIVRHGVLEANMHFLQKPFTGAGLSEKVRAVLDARQAFPR